MSLAGKSVLVTGADGFIGSHLVEALVTEGAKVRALAAYNSFNFWGWLEGIEALEQIEIVNGDIRDPFFVKQITRDIDIVFHLAALIAIPFSYVAPGSYIATNITGTLNICQAALEMKCEKVLVTSTSEVYGTARYVPIDEAHPLQPQSPYSASKIGADAIAMSYYHSFGLPLTIVRPFNTYGPRQSSRAVIPTIISQLMSGVQSVKLGDTSATRDFNYVSDTCRGFLQLAECKNCEGLVVNIGSNSEISIGDLFQAICGIMQVDASVEVDPVRIRPANSEVFRLWCDNTLIKKLTGYTPSISIEEGLRNTIDWFQQPGNLSKYKAKLYNV